MIQYMLEDGVHYIMSAVT
ncbi:Protein of unknown function [Bacillus mycoides]|nr:Protein of unknown function [Bacillus mycoides]